MKQAISRKTSRLLYAEGSLAALFEGFTTAFTTPFALLFQAGNAVIGIMTALPYISTVLSQIPSMEFYRLFHMRRTIVAGFSAAARLVWLPILFIPFLFPEAPLTFFLFFLFLYWLLALAAVPAWTSWVADIVPARIRGQIFGRRNMFVSLFLMLSTVAGGWLLDRFAVPANGFALLFSIGIIFGLLSVALLRQMPEPALRQKPVSLNSLFHVPVQLRRLMTAVSFFNFAYMIASPFFAVYVLKNLGVSYTFFAIFNAISILARIIANPFWGALADRLGDKPIAIICLIGTAFVPFAFLFITPAHALWAVAAFALSGIAWAGVDLSLFNFLLDVTEKEKRAMQTAEFNMVTAMPLVIAPILGGMLADRAAFLGLSGIPLVFALSFFLRLASVSFFTPLRETRVPKEHSIEEVIHEAVHFHPGKGIEHATRVVHRGRNK